MNVLFPAARQIGQVGENIDCAVAKRLLRGFRYQLPFVTETAPEQGEFHGLDDESGW